MQRLKDSVKFLYIFPHPDDESFGPSAAMHQQIKAGHEVHLLTLTQGGATKQRHKLNLSIEEMGKVRYKEMLRVAETLGLTSMEVLDFPDSGLSELDPRILEKTVQQHIESKKPEIVISYPVHGISGFHDHLITHSVVKRVFLEMKEHLADYLKRLAFFTILDNEKPVWNEYGMRIKQSKKELIDCIIPLSEEDIDMMKKTLSCYESYKETIEESGVIKSIGNQVHFEIFNENFDPPIDDLASRLP